MHQNGIEILRVRNLGVVLCSSFLSFNFHIHLTTKSWCFFLLNLSGICAFLSFLTATALSNILTIFLLGCYSSVLTPLISHPLSCLPPIHSPTAMRVIFLKGKSVYVTSLFKNLQDFPFCLPDEVQISLNSIQGVPWPDTISHFISFLTHIQIPPYAWSKWSLSPSATPL